MSVKFELGVSVWRGGGGGGGIELKRKKREKTNGNE